MKNFEYIVVHISDSFWGCAREVRKWHLAKGWRDIGYHFIVLNGIILPNFPLTPLNGSIEVGRYLDANFTVEENEIGAHTLGYNDKSIGICVIGKENWTVSQEVSVIYLCRTLMKWFNIPVQNVLGHCETKSGKKQGKTCPNYPMDVIRAKIIE